MNPNHVCPEDHISYKGKCLYKSKEKNLLADAKHSCAKRGGIVLPVKTKGMYQFIQNYLAQQDSGDVFLGMNMTGNISVFTDNSLYDSSSYDFEGDSLKLVGFPCAYLKRGIKFKPRGTSCEEQYEYVCQWTCK